jgi:hypothetical protein
VGWGENEGSKMLVASFEEQTTHYHCRRGDFQTALFNSTPIDNLVRDLSIPQYSILRFEMS